MKVNVLLSPHNVDELFFTNKVVVVIDVLRATTVITRALQNGAKEVIPVNSIEFAMKVSGNAFGGQTLLGGERNTKMIEGFNLGNSPDDYTEEKVKGKSIILFTTNGSKSIVKAKFAERLFICSFNNLKSVAQKLVEIGSDVVILCSGSDGRFCMEDTVCAGKLTRNIEKLHGSLEITDAAIASLQLNKAFGKNLTEMLLKCDHGQKLIENGFENDVKRCAELSVTDTCPEFFSGVIKLRDINMKAENNKDTEEV